MKVLVTGAGGQLGHDVVKELAGRGIEAVGTDSRRLDITDRGLVDRIMEEEHPDAVIHCAAYTAVDAAEDNEELCRQVNVEGTRSLAMACRRLDCKMIYISTDYVFDGAGERPWEPEDACHPISVYGRSKYEGELAVQEILEKYFIVRVTWTFGINGKNFVKTMLRLARDHDTLKVVDDQFGSPTYTADLAVLLADMVGTDRYGIYHAASEGVCSWYEFACTIFRMAALPVKVLPVTTAQYGARAARPANSRMSKEKLTARGFQTLPHWQDALGRYLDALGQEID